MKDILPRIQIFIYIYIYIYIYICIYLSQASTLLVIHKINTNFTNEDEPLLFFLTPIFRPHLVVFFRVTKKTVNL